MTSLKPKRIKENVYEIPKSGKMQVPGIIFASDNLMGKIQEDKTLQQVKNVSQLPGIYKYSLAMSDAHQGYGFCIGGVAGFDLKKGIISPGGVGYDINCGVRLLSTNLSEKEFLRKRKEVLKELYKNVPSGVGKKTEFLLSEKEIEEVLEKGSIWALENNYATKEDIERTEDSGHIVGANSKKVSPKARGRGRNQLGSIGAGNHFLEIQRVDEIFDKEKAKIFGLKKKGQIVVMIHTGSRGLGHQTASDYIKLMEEEYGFKGLPDRELINAPINSPLGKDYRSAMSAAANFAFVNRQLITHQVRKSFQKFFSKSKISLVYDIAHNIAKFEKLTINGRKIELCIHRKGATRSFGPGRIELPKVYRKTGQPILIPGSMGTFSYVLAGTKIAESLSLASTAHGAGRLLSRTSAKQNLSTKEVKKELKEKDVEIMVGSEKGLLEEAPAAYKDVNEVVKVSDSLGIGKLVAKLKPLAVMKG